MALVFRTDQTTPLTNDQVDNNFKYLRDQITLKYSTSDFTPANISLKLRTTVSGQSSLDLAQANALNSWLLRDLEPSSALPGSTNKSSIVTRDEDGDIEVGTVVGALSGNATSATLAASATKLATARNINGVAFDGTAAITVADSTKLPLAGGTMTGKLNLVAIAAAYAPLNLGLAAPDTNAKVNGDVWATTSGIRYHINGQTDQIAPIASPTFTGIPQAPGYAGTPDQIITLSHLENARSTLATSIALKSNIASPSFTGVPMAPTAAATSNSTQIATTAFVKTATTNTASDLTTAYKAYADAAIVTFSDAVNVLLNDKADLDSPELTGTPLAPTPAAGNNSTRIATTAFTNTAISTLAANLNASIVALQDAIASTRPVPVASVFYIASETVPYGYFEAAGQYISSLTYHDLWVALGSSAPAPGDPANTFRLPDLRGEFVRGWDHSRGLDAGRTLRSSQSSSNLEHNHGVPGDDQLGFANGYGGWTSSSRGSFPYDARSSYGGGGAVWNTTTDGGNESRPHNIALMPIIKW
jgi:hypothetical protein